VLSFGFAKNPPVDGPYVLPNRKEAINEIREEGEEGALDGLEK